LYRLEEAIGNFEQSSKFAFLVQQLTASLILQPLDDEVAMFAEEEALPDAKSTPELIPSNAVDETNGMKQQFRSCSTITVVAPRARKRSPGQ
jgi:hypothetical protein